MTLYERELEAIICLSQTIQSGDMVSTASGTYRAGGAPQNRDTRKWAQAWGVSLLINGTWIPINLYAVIAVHRDGVCVWAVDMEAAPKQLALWGEE